LVYARSRHSSNDFDRSKRQQAVLKALLQQVRSRGILANVSLLPEWMGVLEQNVRTTLPLSDLSTVSDLAGIASKLESDRIAQYSINPLDVQVDNVITSDIYWNPADVATLVKRWSNGSGVPGVVTVQVLNGTGIGGLASQIGQHLSRTGFLVLDPGDSVATSSTTLYDSGDHRDIREKLVAELGLAADQVQINTAVQGGDRDAKLILVIGADYQTSWTGANQ
jgi:hypothetical protein